MSELILTPSLNRLCLLPIQYSGLWEQYKKALASFWIPEEVSYGDDLPDWKNKLTEDERHFVKRVLAFFASADAVVGENLALNFYHEVQLPEARAFYSCQSLMETVHGETYNLHINTLVTDSVERLRLFRAVETEPVITQKLQWAMTYLSRDVPFARRLVAFAVMEGVFFSGAFCALFWLRKRGLCPALCFSNELISRDEALHCEFAVSLYHLLEHKLTTPEIHAIISEAVEVEHEFVKIAIPVRMLGMNADLMCQYIEFVADRLCVQLGYSKLYGSANPFNWMENISIERKVNFFENKVSDYALADKSRREDAFSALDV